MKSLKHYICESSDEVSLEDFCKIAQLEKRFNNTMGNHRCGGRTLNEKELQFYNEKWIYGYSIYWDGNNPYNLYFPIIGVYDGKKAFIMNNKDDIKTFGEHCMKKDNSIFKLDIEKETIKCKTDDYDKTKEEMNKVVSSDKTIIKASIGWNDDRFTITRYKK